MEKDTIRFIRRAAWFTVGALVCLFVDPRHVIAIGATAMVATAIYEFAIKSRV